MRYIYLLLLSVFVYGCGNVSVTVGRGNSLETNIGIGQKAAARDPYFSTTTTVQDSFKIHGEASLIPK